MSQALESRRGQGRIAAMRFLYERDFDESDDLLEAMNRHFRFTKVRDGVTGYARTLIEGTLKHKSQIDQIIAENLKNWDIDRLASVDRWILRVGIFEMMYVSDVPVKVSINEMVEMAKQYSKEDSASFVNGILDAVLQKISEKQG